MLSPIVDGNPPRPELALVEASDDANYPCLERPGQRSWNVTRFEAEKAYLDLYKVHRAGGETALEYRIPAEDLESFNEHVVRSIEVVAEYH